LSVELKISNCQGYQYDHKTGEVIGDFVSQYSLLHVRDQRVALRKVCKYKFDSFDCTLESTSLFMKIIFDRNGSWFGLI